MEELSKQVSCFESIKTLCSNYKKDSSSRKTTDYLNKRLEALEEHWVAFHERNEIIVSKIEDKDKHTYFTSNVYGKTKELYETTKANIIEILISHRQKSETLDHSCEFDLSGIEEESSTHKTTKLMSRQEGNFKALARAMSKINIEQITEKWELEDHLSILKGKWDSVDRVHWQLEEALQGLELNNYTKKFEHTEKKYDELRRQLNNKIWSNIHFEKSAPKIEIPDFHGDYIRWISFKDLFLETIHKNPTISKTQKMQHLKTKLKGEAERLVQHLTVSAENYDSCWEILVHRYDNRRLQFSSYMNVMQQLPVIQNPNTYNIKKLHDVITESLNGLTNMGVDVTSWGPIIVHYMSQKLDTASYNEYSKEIQNTRDLPDIQEFLTFLEKQFMTYETTKNRQKETNYSPKQNTNSSYSKPTFLQNYKKKPTVSQDNKSYSKTFFTAYGKCPLCEGNHVLMQCSKFLEMNIGLRNSTVAKLKVCKNCLYGHGNSECSSSKSCKECNLKHHTLLHFVKKTYEPTKTEKNSLEKPSTSGQQASYHSATSNTEVLLTTVKIRVKGIDGTYKTFRGLLDQGSQVNLISESAAQILRLPRQKLNATVSGVGSVSGDCKGRVQLTCKSIHSDYTFNTQALILKKLTNNIPNSTFEKANWPHLQNLKLGDPDYNVTGSVDLLLSADVYADIIMDGVLKGDQQSPVAQQTQLGWILCGKLKTFNCHATIIDLADLSKYWESEDITKNEDANHDDQCESHYKKNTKRAPDGKYIVEMPMMKNFEAELGNSRPMAVSQFLQLEKRLTKNEKLSTMYKEFINEYSELEHMTLTPRTPTNEGQQCYLPHHGVLRENSSTTKLRVVFNASSKTSSGKSLNALMEKGPNLQKDIQALLLKWKTYKYAYTADIEKMYRCIWLTKNQQPLQKIIWRPSPSEPLQEYTLHTLTYGTKCAPWLAMRTLKQLALDEGHKYPAAAKVLQSQLYLDDLISGHNSLESAKELQKALIDLLKEAGMNLRKWSANCPELLEQLTEDQISTRRIFDFEDENTKTLGLAWNPKMDTFMFNWSLEEKTSKTLTKRTLLSEISQLYDPMGWLSPVTVTAKLIFQKVWEQKLEWDDLLENKTQNEWLKLKAEIPDLKTIKIKRWIGSTDKNIELLGFCDASEKAYSCVIYSRVKDENNQPVLNLVAAKTRVAPIAQKLTLPRLELCGALLLSQLMEKAKNSLNENNITIWAWSDSKVVLAWLQGEPTKWETYVGNRVNKIKEVIPSKQWDYIESKNNPADCATRGLTPKKLLEYDLWWKGPEMLKTFTRKDESETINCLYTTDIDAKQKETALAKTKTNENIIIELINKCSSLSRVKRIVAWILRFITKARFDITTAMKPDAARVGRALTTYLTTAELLASNALIVKYIQRNDFETEYNLLYKNQALNNKSSIYKLNPYLDEGVIRVGGRLNKTNLPTGMKNPMILARDGRLTQLVIEEAHAATLHGGARLTLAYIRQRYWIVGGNRSVKSQLRRCVRCSRYKPTDSNQIMADLPVQRATPSRPFTHTGVDFTGHVDVKLNKGRGVKTSKGYIAIFVCMATKAVHIELVSDLGTDMFIAAFQRMCARRGTPSHMYSDCGTNFIGASKVLRNEYEHWKTELSPEFFHEIGKMEVKWHFNAPGWPSAGGLWEAAVRSMKHHLRRILGDQKLTYEEFATLLSKIEACMNSRPLCPLTEDPEDYYNYLTPGHFLTGSPTMTLPLSSYEDDRNIDLRQRWQRTEHMLSRFWKLWSSDYLSQLQARSKWHKPSKNLEKGDIVLVKDNNLPPGKWAMGKIIETHPGEDGHVRVTTVKTQYGVIKRPIVKLSKLLPNQTAESSTNDEEIRSKSSTKNRKRSGYMSMFISFLTVFALITGSHCAHVDGEKMMSNVQITSLESERPIYYDTIGKIQLIHDEWILLTYYNLSTYWQATHEIENYLTDVKTLCQRLDPRFCESTTQQLLHELEQLKYYNNILLAPHKHLSHRRKRSLIDGVGYVANSLFGVLDQHFAEKYHQDIQAIQKNENYLLQLMKNQTTIIEIENEIMKKHENNVRQQFVLINKFMKDTDNKLINLESNIGTVMATNYYSSVSLTAHLLLTNLKNVQEMLFNALVDVYKGHIDVHLLTPMNLIKQLNEIAGKLPKTLTFPVENIEAQIKDIYKLLYVKARVTSNYFMFEIHIPLTSDEDFILYRPIPLPLSRYQEMARYITTSYEYIAVNFIKNTYISLNDEGLKKCIQKSTDNFVCILNLPLKNLQSKDAPCEAKLLGHETTSLCDMKEQQCDDDWIVLHSTNTWLAICCNDSCVFRTVCAGEVSSYQINTSGLVTLKQGCVMQTKDVSIYAHNLYHSDSEVSLYLAKAPKLDKSINHIVRLSTPQLKQTDNKNLEKTIDKWLEQQEVNELQLPETITSHDIHQYAISYILLAIFVITAIVWVVKKRGWCNRKSTSAPTANPLQQDTHELQARGPTKDEARPTPASREQVQPQPPQKHVAKDIEFSFD